MTNIITKYTDKELLKEIKSLENLIYDVECYGVTDMRLLSALCKEAQKRGLIERN